MERERRGWKEKEEDGKRKKKQERERRSWREKEQDGKRMTMSVPSAVDLLLGRKRV